MESARTFLFILFAFLTFLLYQEWQAANKPEPVKKASVEESLKSLPSLPVDAPELGESAEVTDELASALPQAVGGSSAQLNNASHAQIVEVVTDKLRVHLTTLGGNFVSAELLEYKETLNKDSQPINIFENRNGRTYLAISGLFGEGAPNFDGQEVTYSVANTQYELADSEQPLNVDMKWVNELGNEYIKRFTFYPNKYTVDVSYLVTNNSSKKLANRMFNSLVRDTKPVEGYVSEGFGMQSHLGPAFSTSEIKYEKFGFDDLAEDGFVKQTTQKGWVAILQHYFVTSWVPKGETTNIIDATTKGLAKPGLARIRVTQDWQWIEPGQTEVFSSTLYVGPKIQSRLEEVAEYLDLTVDYGFLWWIGQPIFYLLLFLQTYVINWGVAIILVTIVIKTFLYPLARAQYRSFAKMRLLQPKMAEMKERYGEDRQQMSMKMMELYKKEKVNPLGGCLPLLVQMPVFIALYWVLMESVELRHAPFMLWITDLSVKDPYYILPLLMGASMYLMQKMQPTAPTMDPMQQKMMQMMPVFMTVFFVFFPAGLVLYWLMNNLISISQQLYITNQFNKEQEVKNKAKKKA
ncbi:membrane protein insertase YidC [Aliikangiella sp. IMCC44653]